MTDRVLPSAHDGKRCDFIYEGRVYMGIIIGIDAELPYFYWWHNGNQIISTYFLKVHELGVFEAIESSKNNAPAESAELLRSAAIELRDLVNSLDYDPTAVKPDAES